VKPPSWFVKSTDDGTIEYFLEDEVSEIAADVVMLFRANEPSAATALYQGLSGSRTLCDAVMEHLRACGQVDVVRQFLRWEQAAGFRKDGRDGT